MPTADQNPPGAKVTEPWYTTLMHYVAGGCLLLLSAYATKQGWMEPQVLVMLTTSAAVGVGFKIKG